MDIFEEIVRMRRAGERGALATIVHTNGSIPSYESSRMLVREDGSIAGTIGGGCVEADVWAAAKEVIQVEQPRKMTFNLNHEADYDAGLICGGTLEIFVEPILPQPTLYIFGGGHVSTAVARVGELRRIRHRRLRTIANRSPTSERFPMAGEIYTTYEEAFEKIKPNASSYLVIVTRGHKDDMRVLAWAVRTGARYIGMIGSKRKVLSVYKALESEGYSAGRIRARACARGTRYRRAHAGGNRRQHHGGVDRGAPQRAESAAQIRQARRRPPAFTTIDPTCRSAVDHAKAARRSHPLRRRIPAHGHPQSAASLPRKNLRRTPA